MESAYKPDELFASWEEPNTPERLVQISTVEVAKRGEPIVGVVFFSGCTPNKAGVCETQADFQVFKPDGTAYDAEEKTELWSGKPPPPEGEQ